MVKIKKIVAAALVAAAIGAAGITAFAGTVEEYRFNFVFTTLETDLYEGDGAVKSTDWSDPALVNCLAGDSTNISTSRPVKFAVWDSIDPDYSYRLTPYITATKTNYEYNLPYDTIMGRIVYLNGMGDPNTKVSGKWTP